MNAQVIIVAAGRGTRAGGPGPKQWQMLGRKPMLAWSIEAFLSHSAVQHIAIVVSPDRLETAQAQFASDRISVVPGGESRADSVRAGLNACPGHPLTLVHDAARPGVDLFVIDQVVGALANSDGAAPALPVVDALKREQDGRLSNLDRTGLHRIQTPQGFRTDTLARALEAAGDYVDDFEAAEALGSQLELVPGHERLMKVTFSDDMETVSKLMGIGQNEFRTGQGFDVHSFEPGDHVTLCGINIPHSAGLKGHSDADVGWHALTDAILGAACLGDIGDHFPPSDPQWKNAPSERFLAHAVTLAAAEGWSVAHGDITIICEAPKVKPHRETMRENTARVLQLPINAISVKATTTEGLGFTGRREGISAMATATLRREG